MRIIYVHKCRADNYQHQTRDIQKNIIDLFNRI